MASNEGGLVATYDVPVVVFHCLCVNRALDGVQARRRGVFVVARSILAIPWGDAGHEESLETAQSLPLRLDSGSISDAELEVQNCELAWMEDYEASVCI